eukprot:TRINITY_DN28334_c0_g1_i2.p1 TRINITY_DN28334_c0_g1~~TRINITY_DN28334_c0_g1_i2.p1  ORF type:complete len:218 (-),score=35.68 TRINITY_DN28334_c0_g1_i2:267-920(-)
MCIRDRFSPSSIAVYGAHMAYNSYRYTLSAWMPTYYDTVLHTDPQLAGLHLCLAELTAFVTTLGLKAKLDTLVTSGQMSTRGVRMCCCAGGTSLMAGAVVALAVVPTTHPLFTTLCLCVGWVGLAAAALGWSGNYLDLTKQSAGMLMGVGNTLATLPTFASPLITAKILESSAGWSGVFCMLAGFNMVAVAVYCLFSNTECLDPPPELNENAGKKQD